MRLHPTHGVNPTLAVCQWCGEDTGEVVLLGAAYKGETPMRMVINDVPCPPCQTSMDKGITLIEAREVGGKPERTGRWCVITEDAARRLFTNPPLDAVLRTRKAYVEQGVMEMFMPSGAPDA